MLSIGWMLPEILGVVALIVTGIYIYYKYVIFTFWSKRGLVCPEPTVPVGNLGALVSGTTSIGEVFEEYYKKYKDARIFGTYTFFRPNLVVTDPELIRYVLTKDFASFHDRGMFCNEKIDPLSGHLFLLPGKKWRNLRVKLTPTFTSGKIKQMFQTMNEIGDQLTTFLEKKAEKRAAIEIKEVFARYSTDIIMSVAFGISCNSLENPNCEFRYWGKKVFEPQPIKNSIVMFAPQIFDTLSIPFTKREITKFFTKVFGETVEYRQRNNIVRRDFLNLIMQLMKDGYVEPDNDSQANDETGNSEKLTMLEGAAQAYVFFLAGFETSSTTVTHCLYELALHQDIQDKVRQEMDDVLERHGSLTYDAVQEMSYLQKTISETLRKYPSLPVLNRVCTKEIELPTTNLRIPEGTLITIPVLGIQKDPEIFPDPEKFDPERFNDENVATRHPYTYLPFGEGPRICIGQRFGLTQVKVGLIHALSKFRFRLAPDTPVPIVFDVGNLVLTSKDPINLIIEPR